MARHRRRRNRRERMLFRRRVILCILVALVAIGLIYVLAKYIRNNVLTPEVSLPQPTETEASQSPSESTQDPQEEKKQYIEHVLRQAKILAAGYDYEGAIQLLSEDPYYTESIEMLELVEQYQTERLTLVPFKNIEQVTHISFESIIMDTARAFDGDNRASEYNQKNITYNEFMSILNQLYENDYVLVRMTDLMHYEVTEDANGTVTETATRGILYLPEGKKPLVISQDDVNYYTSMVNNGFANRLVLDENGDIAAEIYLNGKQQVGAYDLIPILEDFIEAHPDFSYHGAKGVIALTGYEGVFGYRIGSDYAATDTYEADVAMAKEVAKKLAENGWEFASHSYAHKHVVNMTLEEFQADCDRWQTEVAPILGVDVSIYIWPFGEDSGEGIGTWRGYEGAKYEYLRSLGFRYFCNVDATNPYWVQPTSNYYRMGRIDITGFRMYDDAERGKNRLGFLFDVSQVFEKDARPDF